MKRDAAIGMGIGVVLAGLTLGTAWGYRTEVQGVLPLTDLQCKATSEQETSEIVYFSPVEGGCAGAYLAQTLEDSVLTLVRGEPGSVDVDLPAAVSTESPWEGFLRIEIPLPEELLRNGGEHAIHVRGIWKKRNLNASNYPARAR